MLYYIESGPKQANPILFLHAGSYSGTMWGHIAERLPQMRCIMLDLPGHGQSRDINLHSLEQAADAVAALILEKFKGGPVNIVGLSFGSYVGVMLVARHPWLVTSAMLSGIQLGSIPNATAMNLFAGLISPLISFHWFRRKMALPLGVTDPEIYERADGQSNVSPRTLRTVLRLASVFDIEYLLPSIDVPTLMIAGKNEHSSILDSLSIFQLLMPDCIARTVPEMGHAWCNEDPDLFAQTVQAWVNGAKLPAYLTDVA